MIGAILGDMIGSPYEFTPNNIKTKEFPLFSDACKFTDDSVMTIAVGEAFLDAGLDADDDAIRDILVKTMRKYGMLYQRAGYGMRFVRWLVSKDPKPYGSYGNGSAMRVSSVAWLYNTIGEVRHAARLSAEVTHNHPEGIKGAEATAAAIFLARTGYPKEEIKTYIEQEFSYNLSRSCDEIRPNYIHVESCMETVPEAITAFLEGNSFEDVIRTAVSLGGDCDTLTAIAGSIAEGYYGVPIMLMHECHNRLPEDLSNAVSRFKKHLATRFDILEGYFFEGNASIEDAIEDVYRTRTRRSDTVVLSSIFDQVDNGTHFIVPGQIVGESDDQTYFQLITFENKSGESWYLAYTNLDQYRAGTGHPVISISIGDLLRSVANSDTVVGVSINPFGREYRLTKENIRVALGERSIEETKAVLNEPNKLHDAIIFATKAHKGQVRKGTDIDYICHPLEVLQILTSMHAENDVLIAGVLHDTVEDTPVTLDEIEARFGEKVATLVGHHSEDKSKTWDERKQTAINELQNADFNTKMLVMADKVSNLRSMWSDYCELGDAFWTRFNAPKEKQAWYYSGIQDALYEMQDSLYTADIYWEMVNLFKDLFVKFYISKDGLTLYQICADGDNCSRRYGEREWAKHRDIDIAELTPIARFDAERLEDSWDNVQ